MAATMMGTAKSMGILKRDLRNKMVSKRRIIYAVAAPETETEVPTTASKMPAKELLLMKLGKSTKPSTTAKGKTRRVAVAEILPMVEMTNPTMAPASSTLLNGSWQFRYCGSPAPGPVKSPTREFALLLYAGGYSPGLFGFELINKLPSRYVEIESVSLEIGDEQPRATVNATLSVFGNKQTLTLKEELDAESDTRVSEKYVGIEALGQSTTLPPPLRYSRSLFITYLDEDLLVVRDESGCPEILTKIVEETVSPPEDVEAEVVVDETSPEDEGDSAVEY